MLFHPAEEPVPDAIIEGIAGSFRDAPVGPLRVKDGFCCREQDIVICSTEHSLPYGLLQGKPDVDERFGKGEPALRVKDKGYLVVRLQLPALVIR